MQVFYSANSSCVLKSLYLNVSWARNPHFGIQKKKNGWVKWWFHLGLCQTVREYIWPSLQEDVRETILSPYFIYLSDDLHNPLPAPFRPVVPDVCLCCTTVVPDSVHVAHLSVWLRVERLEVRDEAPFVSYSSWCNREQRGSKLPSSGIIPAHAINEVIVLDYKICIFKT